MDTSLNGAYGRGAPANGGGGGDSHNAGGGGGANGDNGVTWSGEGNPDTSVASYTTAWNLDGTITATHTDAGGGRGGYTYGANTQDPTTTAPGNTAWGGNNRLERGGLGGRPLTNNPTSATARLFFGGGVGAGDENNSAGTAGGNGGGIVFLVAGTVTGTGTISANGASGGVTPGGGNDGAGGGGAGGSIVVIGNSLSSVALTANGGAGGGQAITSAESEGPGGGGGGGYIAVLGGTPGSASASGGANGTSNSPGIEPPKFPPNGATKGSSGIANATAPALSNFPVCNVPTLAISKADNGPWLAGQVNAQYTLTVQNTGSVATSGTTTVLDTFPTGIAPPATFTSNSWTCSFASPTLTCTSSAAITALGGSSVNTVPVTVTAAAEPSITNRSSVGGGDPNNGGNPPTPGSCSAGDNHCGNDTTAVTAATPPTISKSFGASSIPVNGTTSLSFSINNPNAAASLTGVTVTDPLPSGLQIATPNGLSGSCGGGTITATAGSGSVSLSGATLAASSSCSFSVNVTGTTAGTQTNTTGNVASTNSGQGGTATAMVNVTPVVNVSITKTDSNTPAGTYTPGGTGSYILTITNSGPSTLVNGQISDNLPSGVSLNGAWTCAAAVPANGSSCSAASGSTQASLNALTVTIPAGTGSPSSTRITITVPVQYNSNPAAY